MSTIAGRKAIAEKAWCGLKLLQNYDIDTKEEKITKLAAPRSNEEIAEILLYQKNLGAQSAQVAIDMLDGKVSVQDIGSHLRIFKALERIAGYNIEGKLLDRIDEIPFAYDEHTRFGETLDKEFSENASKQQRRVESSKAPMQITGDTHITIGAAIQLVKHIATDPDTLHGLQVNNPETIQRVEGIFKGISALQQQRR